MKFESKSAVEASRITGMDRAVFNQHVAAGNYPCAPHAASGRPRMFEEFDLLGQRIFYHLITEQNIAPARAGKIACAVVDYARAGEFNIDGDEPQHTPINNDLTDVRYVDLEIGSSVMVPGASIKNGQYHDGYDDRTVRASVSIDIAFFLRDNRERSKPFEQRRADIYAAKNGGK